MAVGDEAMWNGAQRTVTCLRCHEANDPAVVSGHAVASGPAGGSALAEASRQRQRAAERKRRHIEARPVLGRLEHLLNPEPDRGRSWERGAIGEQLLGAVLDRLPDVDCLHDRRIPRSTANIDHLVVAPSGIWVVDAKRHQGVIKRVDRGGWLKSDVRLTVAGRDRTKLIDGVQKQLRHVTDALARDHTYAPPIHGVLCFVEREFGSFRRPFKLHGVEITWPKALYRQLATPGPIGADARSTLVRALARQLPPAT